MSIVTVNEKQWKSFCKILKGLSQQSVDAVINEGVIRQRSNDASAIVEVDMSSMLGSSTFTIADIKEKLTLLKGLTGQVTIDGDQNKLVFSDNFSSYKMPVADDSYLNNKFMSKQELDSLLQNIFQSSTPLIKHNIDKTNLTRIRNAVKTFHANSCKVVFEDHSASVSVKSYGKAEQGKSSMTIFKNIPLAEPTTGDMNLVISPYTTFDYDGDITWELNKGDNSFLSKNYGSIGDLTPTTYTRGSLRNEPPEPLPQPEEIPKEELEATEIES